MLEGYPELGERFLEDAVAIAADHGRELETLIQVGRPSREIVAVAEESHVDHPIPVGPSRVLEPLVEFDIDTGEGQ